MKENETSFLLRTILNTHENSTRFSKQGTGANAVAKLHVGSYSEQ